MKSKPVTPEPEFRRLVMDLIDSKLDANDRARLERMLSVETNAAWYSRVLHLHGMLHFEMSRNQPAIHLPRPWFDRSLCDNLQGDRELAASRSGREWSWRTGSLAALAASLFLAVYLWTARQEENEALLATAEPTQSPPTEARTFATAPTGVAVLAQVAGATWEDTRLSNLSTGKALPAGEYALKAGLVQLEFMSGASVVIEGPAEFELVTPDLMKVGLGKIRAHVPGQAIGFTISTPTHVAKDLGTEFAISVDGRGQSDIHVLDGEVELSQKGMMQQSPIRLVANQLFTSTTGETIAAPGSGSVFAGRREMLEAAEEGDHARYDRWKEHSQVWRQSPDVLVYYGFDGHARWDRELRNESSFRDSRLDGAIVGCRWTSGRWRDKQALEFKRTSDRVRLHVPGEFESLSFAIWVRMEGFDRWLSSLLLTDGHDAGEVHWQLTDLGELVLGVKYDSGDGANYFSSRCLGPEDLGRWVFLACVYDAAAGEVRHYVDGAEVSRESIAQPTRLRIGDAEIGNWEIGDWAPRDIVEAPIRSLNGSVDEFLLFNTAISSERIRSIYEIGRTF